MWKPQTVNVTAPDYLSDLSTPSSAPTFGGATSSINKSEASDEISTFRASHLPSRAASCSTPMSLSIAPAPHSPQSPQASVPRCAAGKRQVTITTFCRGEQLGVLVQSVIDATNLVLGEDARAKGEIQLKVQ